MEPSFQPREVKGSTGPFIGVVIILLLMLAGAVYFWNVQQGKKVATVPYIPGSESTTTTQ